jgi:hypothetical protein
VNKLHSLITKQYSNFVPSSLAATVYSYHVHAKEALIPWPFPAAIAITPHADRLDDKIIVSDPKAIAFIMGHLSEGFSWLRCVVSEGGFPFSINLTEVPGWYEPLEIKYILGALTMELDQDERPK